MDEKTILGFGAGALGGMVSLLSQVALEWWRRRVIVADTQADLARALLRSVEDYCDAHSSHVPDSKDLFSSRLDFGSRRSACVSDESRLAELAGL